MEIFTPIKILLVCLIAFISLILVKEFTKNSVNEDLKFGRPYREFCIDMTTNKNIPCYF